MCSCALTFHMPQNKAKSSSSLVFLIINVYSNQTVLTCLERWVCVAQEVHWVVEDEHFIPTVGSSSLSNINQTSSCYAVAKKGSCGKLGCRKSWEFGLDLWVAMNLVYTHKCTYCSVESVMVMLWAGQLTNCGSIIGGGGRRFSSPKYPGWLWGPTCILFIGYLALLLCG